MPVLRSQIHICAHCTSPAVLVGSRLQAIDDLSAPPPIQRLCRAHSRYFRWEESRPPEGYGHWGCHNCRNSYVNVPLHYDGTYGTFNHDYQHYVGDYEYDISESPLYVYLHSSDLCDAMLEAAFNEAPEQIDINVPDVGRPGSLSEFLDNEAYGPVRESIYDNFVTGRITCTDCGIEIDGDLD